MWNIIITLKIRKLSVMKLKLFTIFFLTFISFSLFGQMSMSTDYKTNFIWDDKNEDWVEISSDKNNIGFFEINRELTLIKHTTSKGITAYMIKSFELDEETGQYMIDLMSDSGYEYFLIFDLEKENLRFIFYIEEDLFMSRYNIKRMWMEDEN